MAFWNEDYSIELQKISSFLERKFSYLSESFEDLGKDTESLFVDRTTYNAWRYFENLYLHHRESLNEYTEFNQKSLQQRAKPELSLYKEAPVDFLSLLIRLLFEYNFWNSNDSSPPDFLSNETFEKLDKVENNGLWRNHFRWIERTMPTIILKDLLQSENFRETKDLAKNINDYKNNVNNFISNAQQKFDEHFTSHKVDIENILEKAENTKEEIKEYEIKLENVKNQYNFTLLSRAFNNLKNSKKKDLNKIRKVTLLLSTLLLAPPLFTFLNHSLHWIDVGKGIASLTYYLPIITTEILIFYFMRLYYGEVRLLSTQLLQIEHRLSLCEFVQDYIRNKNIDNDNKSSWDSFEALIFSPIQASADNIPSIIDGANVVAELAGKVMSKTKNS